MRSEGTEMYLRAVGDAVFYARLPRHAFTISKVQTFPFHNGETPKDRCTQNSSHTAFFESFQQNSKLSTGTWGQYSAGVRQAAEVFSAKHP